MRFVKHTQQERAGISGKINYFAEVYPKMNVQVDMRDPETPAFNCQGRNCVAINCMENLVLVSSVVFTVFTVCAFQVFGIFETYLLKNVSLILNHASLEICGLLLHCKVT